MMGIDDIIGQGLSLINKFIPDKDAQEKAAAEYKLTMLQVQAQVDATQAATNTAEASNTSAFVSSWRPFIGWVCGAAFAWHFVLQPVVNWFVMAGGGHSINPAFDSGTLTTVLMGMLGLGGLHVYENTRPK